VNAALLAAMNDAWTEVDLAFRQKELIGQVLDADAEQLADHGLTGTQLDFKLIAWHQSRERMRASFVDSDDPDPGSDAEPESVLPSGVSAWFGRLRATIPRRVKNGLKYLRKTFANADILLGSLAATIPGFDMLTEFKEAVEGIAEDKAEELPDDDT
jgi:hypothetical protein